MLNQQRRFERAARSALSTVMKLAISLVVFSLGVSLLGNPTANHAHADKPTKPVKVLTTAKVAPEHKETTPVPATASPVAVAAPAPEAIQAPTPAPQPAAPTPVYSSDHNALMAAAGIAESDFGAVDYIVSHESGWCATKWEGQIGYCPGFHGVPDYVGYGMCQSTPASKMAAAGGDYATNPVTQLIWCNSYAVSRYGGWWSAYSHWLTHHNW